MPISKSAYNLLVYISQKPRTTGELSVFLKEKYCDNDLYKELDPQGYWLFKSKFHISEKGRIAIEDYKRTDRVVTHSLVTAIATSLGCLIAFGTLVYQIFKD